MANASWPATLPDDVLVDGYQETPPKTAIRTQMDAGPAKQRRRFTAGVEEIRCRIALTRAQVQLFLDFINDTLEGGTLPFDWVHPRTQAAATLRFNAERLPEPKPEGRSQVSWTADMELEILP